MRQLSEWRVLQFDDKRCGYVKHRCGYFRTKDVAILAKDVAMLGWTGLPVKSNQGPLREKLDIVWVYLRRGITKFKLTLC